MLAMRSAMPALPLMALTLYYLQRCHYCLASASHHPHDPTSLSQGHVMCPNGGGPQYKGHRQCCVDLASCTHNLYIHAYCEWRGGSCAHLKMLQKDKEIVKVERERVLVRSETRQERVVTDKHVGENVEMRTQDKYRREMSDKYEKNDGERQEMRRKIVTPNKRIEENYQIKMEDKQTQERDSSYDKYNNNYNGDHLKTRQKTITADKRGQENAETNTQCEQTQEMDGSYDKNNNNYNRERQEIHQQTIALNKQRDDQIKTQEMDGSYGKNNINYNSKRQETQWKTIVLGKRARENAKIKTQYVHKQTQEMDGRYDKNNNYNHKRQETRREAFTPSAHGGENTKLKTQGMDEKRTINDNKWRDIVPPTPVLPPPPYTTTKTTPSSSVWCHTTTESGLQCHFKNLYYSPVHEEFAFISDNDSVLEGITSIDELKGHLHLSSVAKHNIFHAHISAVPPHALASATVTTVQGVSLVIARFKPDNLHHVLHDDVLPVYLTSLRLSAIAGTPYAQLTLMVADMHGPSPYHALYQAVSRQIILASDLRRDGIQWLRLEAAAVGPSRRSVWYQYGFGMPQGPIASRFTGGELSKFASFMRERLGLSVDATSDVDAVNDPVSARTSKAAPSTTLRAVLLTRHVTRKILNEMQLADAIRQVILGTVNEGDVRVASLEENGLADLIRVISEATVLVGMHGAALSLAMFLPRGSVLIEMWPYGIDPMSASVYKAMCALEDSGITYMTWMNEDECNTRTHPEYLPHFGGVWHMASAERKRVTSGLHGAKLTSVTCCDDPDWLYRIYQDTEVRLYANDGDYAYGTRLRSVPFTDVLRNGLLTRDKASQPTQTTQKHTPARVRDLRCSLHKDGSGMMLDVRWRNPWTVEALGCENVKYEVVAAPSVSDGSGVTTDYVKSEVYMRRFDYVVQVLHVWVTCLCEGIEGPLMHVNCGVT